MQNKSVRLLVVMGVCAVAVLLASVFSIGSPDWEPAVLGVPAFVVLLPGMAVLQAVLHLVGIELPPMPGGLVAGAVSWAFWSGLGYTFWSVRRAPRLIERYKLFLLWVGGAVGLWVCGATAYIVLSGGGFMDHPFWATVAVMPGILLHVLLFFQEGPPQGVVRWGLLALSSWVCWAGFVAGMRITFGEMARFVGLKRSGRKAS